MKKKRFNYLITLINLPRRNITHDKEVEVFIEVSEVGGGRSENHHDEFNGDRDVRLLSESGLFFGRGFPTG